jgi:putative peptide zinc metalloprotease protein
MGVVLTDDSVIQLHSLVIGPEADGVREVGRPETGVFIELPLEGFELLSWLDGGSTLDEVRRRFASTHGIAPELAEFVADLVECGFVKTIDGAAAPADAAAEPPGRGWRLFAALPQQRVAWLLGRPMRWLYLGVWLVVPVLLAVRPHLIPDAGSALVSSRAGINALLLAVFSWALWFLHEFAHLLAVRARGCVGALSISRRLYFLVAQTDMSGIRAISRPERYAPYLAGMTFDMSVLLVGLLLQLAGFGRGIAALLTYIVGVQLVFQLAIFLRTDLYFVLTNWLRTGNLTQDVRDILRDRWRRLAGRPGLDLSGISDRERRIAQRYLPFYLLGMVAALANLVVFVLPVLVTLVARAVGGVAGHGGEMSRWDGVAFLAVIAINVGLLGSVVYRERRVR